MYLLLSASAASRIENSGNDLADICRMLSADRRNPCLPGKREAISSVRQMLAANSAMRAVDVLVRCGDDSVELLRVGKRGGFKLITRVWDKAGVPC
jgi:hypothetical protein